MLLYTSIICLTAFFMGSLPTGYLVARTKGINIKSVGSGNIGATNVTRAMGKGWGAFVLIIDALKGFIPVLFVKLYFRSLSQTDLYALMTVSGVFAVAGHVFTPFLGFKGGKGIATTIGMLLALSPLFAGIVIMVWLILFLITRMSSVGALSAALSMPLITYFLFHRQPVFLIMISFACFMTVFIFFTHRENLQRLYRGEEKAFKKK